MSYDTSILLKQRIISEHPEFIVLPTNLLQQIALFLESPRDIFRLCRSCKYLYNTIWQDTVWWKNYYKYRFRQNPYIGWFSRDDELVVQFVKYRCRVDKTAVDTTDSNYFEGYEGVTQEKMTELNELVHKFHSIIDKWDILVSELCITQRSYGFQINFKLCFFDQEVLGRCFELMCYNSYLVTRSRKVEFLTATEMHLMKLNEHQYGYSDHYFAFWNVSELLESPEAMRPNKDSCVETKSMIMCVLNLNDNSWGQFFEYLNLYW